MDSNPPYMGQSETINYIRTLLMAHNEMYTLGEFLRDFEEDNGYDLPAFGYGNSLEFLKSIPNTVQVIPTKNNIYLKLIMSQTADYLRDDEEILKIREKRRRRRSRGGRRRQNARKEKAKNEPESEDRPESPNE